MFKLPDSFEVKKPSTWQASPTIENEEAKKKLFGIELAKGIAAFQAALNVCGQNTNEALWVSQHWLIDPIVAGARDSYLKTVDTSSSLLDADQLAAKLLDMAEEKNATDTYYILDGKDRLKALELYAEIKGMIGKTAIDLSTKNFTFKQMVVKFVEPEKKQETIIEHNSNEPEFKPALKLKLVS